MYAGKPIIGIAGGIGSGKSTIARMFAPLGCLVIDSDEQVHLAYNDPDVREKLRAEWGNVIFLPSGAVDHSALAQRVFSDPGQRLRLERILHPIVLARRDAVMANAASDPSIVAFVWDTPLLFETGLYCQCDAIVYVDAPFDTRLLRVQQNRHWTRQNLLDRENLQWPLDKKREIAEYVIYNASDADSPRDQVRQVLSRILAKHPVDMGGVKNSRPS